MAAYTIYDTHERGFSIIELLIVCALILIMTAMSIFAFRGNRRAFYADDETRTVLEVMRDASQRALSRRRRMRFVVAVNTTSREKELRIFDDGGPGTADDNPVPVRRVTLAPAIEVRITLTAPSGVSKPNPPNYADRVFTQASGEDLWQIWFWSDGTVRDSADVLTSGNLFIYPPRNSATDANPRATNQVRCITIFGGTGAVRPWQHNGTTFIAR